MTTRRQFLSGVAGATVGSVSGIFGAKTNGQETVKNEGKSNKIGKMRLSFRPYLLELRHAFGVAGSTRKTTQGVQVEIELDGVVGYGEAAMPPYLSESTASVLAFLERVDLSQFKSPFELEDVLSYVDGICENNCAAKAS
ncbi:MAG: dipeptide epimerase, partial [Thermoguttaceae bacterium]|nr:dipeptide epimerase [Thermoguttaceae bacterium]